MTYYHYQFVYKEIQMDINKALKFTMEDKDWVKKLLIAVVISFLSFFVIPAFLLGGYGIRIIRQVMNGQWDGLPEWDDWGGLLKDGFFVAAAEFVYTLPFIILIFIAAAATGGLASLNDSGAAGIFAGGGALLMFCLIILMVIVLLFLMPALTIQYAIKNDFGALFRFSEITEIIRNNMSDILIVFAVMIGASIVLSLVASIPILGWIVAIVAGPYISFVGSHLFGQIGAKVLGNKAGGAL